ncbi:NMD protein affecting ribosome stability and mRNA decay [Halorhabdus sp. SVX81]|uniref:60S ribosomal export protein NMD3 n=1 Tax=Halorhabdus sp. SVX81 TaxID=2978283 RepID=UPI0023DC17B0|nr:60S ribosomal export protein NMD3 [Halorhabdus sp. SVX81]WEL16786.1 NMD protein affecting ribosome stability and mRNA decay [Halorhabdus sp. SVX81]
MTRSGAFCPRCGDAIESDPTERPGQPGAHDPDSVLCDACYFEEFDLVDAPERIEVRVCSRCGAVHRGNRWLDVGAEDYTDVAIEETSESLGVHLDATDVSWQVAPEQVDRNTIRMHATFSGVVRGTAVTEEVVVPVKVSRQVCTRCGRIAGGSYASTVQVRARDRTPTDDEIERAQAIAHEIVADMEATGARDAFVTEVGEDDDGVNIKVSTTNIGKQIASRIVGEFGGSFSDSETLITEDEDGNEVYRVTYAVRLPPYRPGEVIDPEDGDGPVIVRSVQGNLKGTRLKTGDAYEASFEAGDAPDARRLGGQSDGVETTLVAVEDDHAVQVLDPETYETKSIPRPDYLDADAETVPVLKSRAGLHVLPSDDADEINDE